MGGGGIEFEVQLNVVVWWHEIQSTCRMYTASQHSRRTFLGRTNKGGKTAVKEGKIPPLPLYLEKNGVRPSPYLENPSQCTSRELFYSNTSPLNTNDNLSTMAFVNCKGCSVKYSLISKNVKFKSESCKQYISLIPSPT